MQHPDTNSIEAFSQRTLPPEQMLEVSDHLAACDACREQAEAHAAAASGIEWFPAEGSSLHLSEEEFAAAAQYGDAVDPLTRSHLAECAKCRAEVVEVRRFHTPVAVMQPRKVVPRPVKIMAAWMQVAGAGLLAAGVAFVVVAVHIRHSSAPSPATVSNVPKPALVAELRDGPLSLGLDSAGQLQGAGSLPVADSALLAQVLATRRLPHTGAVLAGGADDEMLRGDASPGAGFSVLSPIREKTSGTPEFRWDALPGAKSYVVEVHDDAFHLIARSPSLTQTAWTLPRALAPGHEYSWVVKAQTAGGAVQTPQPPMPEAHFLVVTAADIAAIDAARQQAGGSHLLLAATYARLGMTTEARTEIEALEKQNPNSPLVKDLARSVMNPKQN